MAFLVFQFKKTAPKNEAVVVKRMPLLYWLLIYFLATALLAASTMSSVSK